MTCRESLGQLVSSICLVLAIYLMLMYVLSGLTILIPFGLLGLLFCPQACENGREDLAMFREQVGTSDS